MRGCSTTSFGKPRRWIRLCLQIQAGRQEVVSQGFKKEISFGGLGFIPDPRRKAGGFRPLRKVKHALSIKWLWRIEEDGEGLWKMFLVAKYDVSTNGWDIHGPSYCFFGL